jgi:hypothetical protein
VHAEFVSDRDSKTNTTFPFFRPAVLVGQGQRREVVRVRFRQRFQNVRIDVLRLPLGRRQPPPPPPPLAGEDSISGLPDELPLAPACYLAAGARSEPTCPTRSSWTPSMRLSPPTPPRASTPRAPQHNQARNQAET